MRLYVGNLSYHTEEAQLEKLFATLGRVESVRLLRDRDRDAGPTTVASKSAADETLSEGDGDPEAYTGPAGRVHATRPPCLGRLRSRTASFSPARERNRTCRASGICGAGSELDRFPSEGRALATGVGRLRQCEEGRRAAAGDCGAPATSPPPGRHLRDRSSPAAPGGSGAAFRGQRPDGRAATDGRRRHPDPRTRSGRGRGAGRQHRAPGWVVRADRDTHSRRRARGRRHPDRGRLGACTAGPDRVGGDARAKRRGRSAALRARAGGASCDAGRLLAVAYVCYRELGWVCEREGNAIDWRGLVIRARDYDIASRVGRALRLARDSVATNVPSDALEELSAALPLADDSIAAIACEAMFFEGVDGSDGALAVSDVPRAAVSRPAPGMPSGEPAGTVAVTYDPTTTDGVGSQLLRIDVLYALSRALHVQYIDTPIGHVGYQGFLPLLSGRNDPDFTARYNAFFALPSDDFDFASCERVRIHILTEAKVEDHRRRAGAMGRPVLLEAIHHYGYTDRHPAAFHAVRAVSPYRECRASGPIRVCIHLRRGDNGVPGRTDTAQRLLPNGYYLHVCSTVLDALRRHGAPFVVRLHTEVPTRRYTLYPDTPGLYFRLDEPATVDPSDYTLDEFEALPNLEMVLNVDAREALDDFATADVLILSRSSLGYVGGLLNPYGVVVYAPWWHPPLPDWLVADEDGSLDAAQVGTRIAEHLRRR